MAKKAKHKKNIPKRKALRKKKRKGGDEDDRQRRKYKRGGRIEAYTFGEAMSSKDWP